MTKKYMYEALKEAQKAYFKNEVPVGCVIVYNDKIIARAHNLREKSQNPLAHAEMLAIQKASKLLKSWRLEECSMYVTLEPCYMCSGAIIQSRIKNLYYGALDPKSGACKSVFNLFEYKFNHQLNVEEYLIDESTILLQDFFKKLRKMKNICQDAY